LPLIASSIMSKKIAAGADGIVLDVKMGDGAFMTNLEDARQLAQMMVEIGVDAGRDMIAVISDMNQPLGQAVGNALEVAEAIETLNGAGPDDLHEHCLQVAAYMLRLAGQGEKWADIDNNRDLLSEHLQNGAALTKFRDMVVAQGGDVSMVDDPAKLPQAQIIESVRAGQDGYISRVAAKEIALAAFELGAGREKKDDTIDLAVGVKVLVNVGDAVRKGDEVARVHANDAAHLPACYAHIDRALTYSTTPVDPLPLFYDTIFGEKPEQV
jgi:pyrimidine-nucleoside phosphorylase